MSKGSAVRPKQVSDEQYAQRWDLIFGRDKPNEYQMDRNLYEAEIADEPETKVPSIEEKNIASASELLDRIVAGSKINFDYEKLIEVFN